VRQGGVFRTNCIDCLDRTNVVQGLLGRNHLQHVLRRADLLPNGAALQTAFPVVRPPPSIQLLVQWPLSCTHAGGYRGSFRGAYRTGPRL